MNAIIPSLLAAAVLLPAPVRAQTGSPGASGWTGPLADSLRSIGYEMIEMLQARDVSGILALYGDTLRFVHVDGGTVVPWKELSGEMRAYLTTATSNPVSLVGEPEVVLMDSDNAVLYLRHRFGGTSDDAHEGVWTGVLHRSQEGWRIVHSHSSDRAAEPDP